MEDYNFHMSYTNIMRVSSTFDPISTEAINRTINIKQTALEKE